MDSPSFSLQLSAAGNQIRRSLFYPFISAHVFFGGGRFKKLYSEICCGKNSNKSSKKVFLNALK